MGVHLPVRAGVPFNMTQSMFAPAGFQTRLQFFSEPTCLFLAVKVPHIEHSLNPATSRERLGPLTVSPRDEDQANKIACSCMGNLHHGTLGEGDEVGSGKFPLGKIGEFYLTRKMIAA